MTGAAEFARPDDGGPLRTLVVGAGAMGMAWLRAVQRHADLELAGVVDIDERRAKGALIRLRRTEVPVAATIGGLDGVPADICVNVTPPDAHAPVIEHALTRGLAVLSEKPLTAELSDAVRLTELANDRRQLLMAAQSRSYEPGLFALRDMVSELGAISSVAVDFGQAYPASGFRATMADPLLRDMAVHTFDAVRRLTGSRPVAGYCDAFNPPGSGYLGCAAAMAVFELDGGIRFLYHGSWCAPGLPTSWNGRWRVSCAEGTVEWDGTGPPRVGYADGRVVVPTGGPDATFATPDAVEQVERPLDDFVRALRTGRRPWGVCDDNLSTLAMVEVAVTSARTGCYTRVADVLPTGASR